MIETSDDPVTPRQGSIVEAFDATGHDCLAEIAGEPGDQCAGRGSVFDVDISVLDRPPEPFTEDELKDEARG